MKGWHANFAPYAVVWHAGAERSHGAGIISGCHAEIDMNPYRRAKMKLDPLGSVPEVRKPH